MENQFECCQARSAKTSQERDVFFANTNKMSRFSHQIETNKIFFDFIPYYIESKY